MLSVCLHQRSMNKWMSVVTVAVRRPLLLTAVIKSFLCILGVTTRAGGLQCFFTNEVGVELPAGASLLVRVCAVCSSARCFSHGSPSREVMLRNAAKESSLAEQTPHQPRSLAASSPPRLAHRRLFVQRGGTAGSRAARLTLAEGDRVTCR